MARKYYLTAYQLWLEQGNVGTEADFLAALKGEKGDGFQPKYEYDTLAELNTATTDETISPEQGEAALVGTSEPYKIYTYSSASTTWTYRGYYGANSIESIDLHNTNGLTKTYKVLYTDGTADYIPVSDGVPSYTHIRYGTSATPDTLLTIPNNYMGIAVTTSDTAPVLYTAYNWFKIKGETGYTVAYDNGYTDTFEVTNGNSIASIVKTNTVGLVDTYTITYDDGTTSTYDVTNGNGIASIARTSGNGAAGTTDTYTITYDNGGTTTFPVYNGADGTGVGDMLKSTYDTANKAQDVFDYADTAAANRLPTVYSVGSIQDFIDVLEDTSNYTKIVIEPVSLNIGESISANVYGTISFKEDISLTFSGDYNITFTSPADTYATLIFYNGLSINSSSYSVNRTVNIYDTNTSFNNINVQSLIISSVNLTIDNTKLTGVYQKLNTAGTSPAVNGFSQSNWNNAFVFDSTPTNGSLNPVTSGGVKTALDGKSDTTHTHSGTYEPANANIQSHISNTSNPHSVDKTDVGLANVDNTSDANKPVSTAQQTALDLMANKDLSNVSDNDFLTKAQASGIVTDIIPENKTRYKVVITSFDGGAISNRAITLTKGAETVVAYTKENGEAIVEIDYGTWTLSLTDVPSGYKTPIAQEIEGLGGTQTTVNFFLDEKTVIKYGVRIQLNNSNPETSVEYINDSAGFTPSVTSGSSFVDNGWANRWPFNAIKPCLFKDGVVVGYLNPNNYAQFEDCSAADITSGTAGDVMVEFPKMYLKISRDASYQYIEIAD